MTEQIPTSSPEPSTTEEPASVATSGTLPKPRRGSPRVFTLLVGVACLLACVYALTDGAIAEYSFGLTWWLAGAALLAGVLILASTLRPRRRNR